jgi:hypothetical protein
MARRVSSEIDNAASSLATMRIVEIADQTAMNVSLKRKFVPYARGNCQARGCPPALEAGTFKFMP